MQEGWRVAHCRVLQGASAAGEHHREGEDNVHVVPGDELPALVRQEVAAGEAVLGALQVQRRVVKVCKRDAPTSRQESST
eukprot:1896373-Pleurochrysis_carterae.AAC.1